MKKLNPNTKDACCRCGRVLPVPEELLEHGVGKTPPGDDVLVVFRGSGGPPQYLCGKCSKEYDG